MRFFMMERAVLDQINELAQSWHQLVARPAVSQRRINTLEERLDRLWERRRRILAQLAGHVGGTQFA